MEPSIAAVRRRQPVGYKNDSDPIVVTKCEGDPIIPRAKLDADVFHFVQVERYESVAESDNEKFLNIEKLTEALRPRAGFVWKDCPPASIK